MHCSCSDLAVRLVYPLLLLLLLPVDIRILWSAWYSCSALQPDWFVLLLLPVTGNTINCSDIIIIHCSALQLDWFVLCSCCCQCPAAMQYTAVKNVRKHCSFSWTGLSCPAPAAASGRQQLQERVSVSSKPTKSKLDSKRPTKSKLDRKTQPEANWTAKDQLKAKPTKSKMGSKRPTKSKMGSKRPTKRKLDSKRPIKSKTNQKQTGQQKNNQKQNQWQKAQKTKAKPTTKA